MACIAIKDGQGETLYCAVAWAMEGASGVPNRRGCLRMIRLIRVQRPRTKRISCEGQGTPSNPAGARRHGRSAASVASFAISSTASIAAAVGSPAPPAETKGGSGPPARAACAHEDASTNTRRAEVGSWPPRRRAVARQAEAGCRSRATSES